MPTTASLSLTTAAPTIVLSHTSLRFCIPFSGGYTRACGSRGTLGISNIGGGTLNWTAIKNASWLKRWSRSGTAPSTMVVRVDGTGVPPGSYVGWIKVWATGATNSPQTVGPALTIG
jgi:hypothetical protein